MPDLSKSQFVPQTPGGDQFVKKSYGGEADELPELKGTHRRFWKSGTGATGQWHDKPPQSFGTEMQYMDVESTKAEKFKGPMGQYFFSERDLPGKPKRSQKKPAERPEEDKKKKKPGL